MVVGVSKDNNSTDLFSQLFFSKLNHLIFPFFSISFILEQICELEEKSLQHSFDLLKRYADELLSHKVTNKKMISKKKFDICLLPFPLIVFPLRFPINICFMVIIHFFLPMAMKLYYNIRCFFLLQFPIRAISLQGNPKYALVSYINSMSPRPYAVIVNSRGMGAIHHIFLGSTSDYLLHNVEVPVVLVKGGPENVRTEEDQTSQFDVIVQREE